MEKRIFMACKNEHCVGINYDESTDTPTSFKMSFDGSDTNDEKNTALKALIHVMKEENTDEYDNITQIFINRNLYEFLVFGGYKYWLKTGVQLNGLPVPEESMKLYAEFNELWKEKGDNFVLKDIFTCPISEDVKKNENLMAKISLWSQRNDVYANWCWSELNKIVVQSMQNKIKGVI